MRKVVLYIAMSLDGYIADSQGSVNWIKGQDDTAEMPDTYTPFFESVDTVVMGRRTYDQIVTELSPHKWPYDGATTYVLTRDSQATDSETVRFRNTNPCRLVETIRREDGKDIWICGGAETARQLIEKNLIRCRSLVRIRERPSRGSRCRMACSSECGRNPGDYPHGFRTGRRGACRQPSGSR